MKLYFAVGTTFQDIVVCETWKEVKETNFYPISYQRYLQFKLIEYHDEFWEFIVGMRKKIGIPENGYSWDVIKRNLRIDDIPIKKESTDDFEEVMKLFEAKRNAINNIRSNFILHKIIDEQLDTILLGNFIHLLPEENIWIEFHGDEGVDEGKDPDYVVFVRIGISAPISRHSFDKEINKKWPEIEYLVNKISDPSTPTISGKNLRIFELRFKDHLKYRVIADKLEKELDVTDGSVTEDSVRQAYKRMEQKISSLIKKR